MRITFVGVGESFDETLPNTSLLVESGETSLLLDCGFSVPHAFWQLPGNGSLDAVFLSHYHADHWFGLPMLLSRFVEEGRTRPLTVTGHSGVEDRVSRLSRLAYPNTLDKAQFPISYVTCKPDGEQRLGPFILHFAASEHAVPNLAVRVEGPGGKFFYSGDGRPTPETRALAKGCPLVVHEAFSLGPGKPGHGTIATAVDFAREAGASTLALVHIQRQVRLKSHAEILAMAERQNDLKVLLPGVGETIKM